MTTSTQLTPQGASSLFIIKPEEIQGPKVNEAIGETNVYSSQVYISSQTRFIIEQRKELTFRNAIYDGIKEKHAIARNHFFLHGALIKGEDFCAKAYTRYLGHLYLLHTAIEKEQKKLLGQNPHFAFIKKDLFRSDALIHDIAKWSEFPSDLKVKFFDISENRELFIKNIFDMTEAEPATRQFAQKLAEAQQHNLYAVIGCMYALYGTIMSGGQSVKNQLINQYATRTEDSNDPVQFFTINGITDVDMYKLEWDRELNLLPVNARCSEEGKQQMLKTIIEYANFTFETIFQFIDQMNLKQTC